MGLKSYIGYLIQLKLAQKIEARGTVWLEAALTARKKRFLFLDLYERQSIHR